MFQGNTQLADQVSGGRETVSYGRIPGNKVVLTKKYHCNAEVKLIIVRFI